MQFFEKLKRSIDNVEEKSFKDIMLDVNYIFPVSMTKKITQLFKNVLDEKNNKIKSEDVELGFR